MLKKIEGTGNLSLLLLKQNISDSLGVKKMPLSSCADKKTINFTEFYSASSLKEILRVDMSLHSDTLS
jgi:hypothetical protein